MLFVNKTIKCTENEMCLEDLVFMKNIYLTHLGTMKGNKAIFGNFMAKPVKCTKN